MACTGRDSRFWGKQKKNQQKNKGCFTHMMLNLQASTFIRMSLFQPIQLTSVAKAFAWSVHHLLYKNEYAVLTQPHLYLKKVQ